MYCHCIIFFVFLLLIKSQCVFGVPLPNGPISCPIYAPFSLKNDDCCRFKFSKYITTFDAECRVNLEMNNKRHSIRCCHHKDRIGIDTNNPKGSYSNRKSRFWKANSNV